MAWLAVLAVLSTSQVVCGLLNSTSVIKHQDGSTSYPCLQVNHTEPELESSMMGDWYVIEIILHRDESKTSWGSETCPKLTLFKSPPKFIRLNWQEKAGEIQYNFKMVDPENFGFWLNWGKQNGSMLNKHYQQFEGVVQVIEAQPTRMVLKFCSNNIRHYSVIMVRNITVTYDTRDVHQKLSLHHLPEVNVIQTCRAETSKSTSTKSLLPTSAIIISSTFLLLSILQH